MTKFKIKGLESFHTDRHELSLGLIPGHARSLCAIARLHTDQKCTLAHPSLRRFPLHASDSLARLLGFPTHTSIFTRPVIFPTTILSAIDTNITTATGADLCSRVLSQSDGAIFKFPSPYLPSRSSLEAVEKSGIRLLKSIQILGFRFG
ncbi:hypothetical protein LXL04_034082 [Taraxacum kok-saghyz]